MNLSSAHLTFDDEFDSFLWSPNGSIGWMTAFPFGGENARTLVPNGEKEYYSDSSVGINPFSIKNGVLDITATKSPAGSNPYGLPYTSGVITTYKSFSQLYGYFEIRAELPAGKGLWPAFWMLPADNVNTTELDIFEVLGNNPSKLYVTTHDTASGTDTGVETALNVANTSTGFHTYGVDWEPDTITFYIDGVAVASDPTPASMHVPMYMLIDLAVGGKWPGSPNSATVFPATMQIDYVRAYATANTTDVGGTQAILLGGVTGLVLLNGVAQIGVSVVLLDEYGNVLARTTSGSGGAFSFAGQPIGNTKLEYTLSSGKTFIALATLSAGQTVALGATDFVAGATLKSTVLYGAAGRGGVTVSLVNASGSVIATTTTASNGSYSFIGLAAGTYQVQFTAPSGTVLKPGSQAGTATGLTAAVALKTGQTLALPSEVLVTASSLSGYVALNGSAAAGVTVTLLPANGTAAVVRVTGSDGSFSFGNLQAGQYQLRYTAPSGAVLQTGSLADSGTGLTPSITLGTGQAVAAGTELLLTNPAEIQGSVHHFGGASDPSWGTGESGVTVSLLYASGAVIATTVTSKGWFAFSNLAPGTYQLLYTPPAGQAIMAGSTADPATGLTAPITVSAGQNYFAPNGSLVSTTGISGQVLVAGVGEAGVTVSLLGDTGKVLAKTLTGITGAFAFTGLGAGTYSVRYTPPTGQTLATGSAANTTTGTTSSFTLAAGGAVTLAPETLVIGPATVSGSVHHFGSADPSWGTGQSGVGVTLLDASGATVATTVSDGGGWFVFRNLAPGSYQLHYTPPAGEALQPGGTADVTTGNTASFTLVSGQNLGLPIGGVVSSSNTFTLTGTGATALRGDGNYTVTGNASKSTLTLGAGNQTVTLTGTTDTVTTGDGNQTISLAGTGNHVTIGMGTSVVGAGSGGAVVHAGGGTVTITATGANNLFDGGGGANFLNADGSAGNVFMTNAGGAGLTTVTGFNTATTDVLDLARSLAGTAIRSDLSNVGTYITSSIGAGGTTLYVDPTGTQSALSAFAVLNGVSTTVSDLLAGGHLSL